MSDGKFEFSNKMVRQISKLNWIDDVYVTVESSCKQGAFEKKAERWTIQAWHFKRIKSFKDYDDLLTKIVKCPLFDALTLSKDVDDNIVSLAYKDSDEYNANEVSINAFIDYGLGNDEKAELFSKITGCDMVRVDKQRSSYSTWTCKTKAMK